MKGYKGIVLKTGILRSKYDDIFEVGIPREFHDVDDGFAFSEAGYSFCGTIEDVIYHENYICTEKQRRCREVRLFEIDTENGKVVGESSYHLKTTNIKIIREVTQHEILEYLKANKKAMEQVLKEVGKDVFETYICEEIEPYRRLYDIKDIENVYVKSCLRIGQKELCSQDISAKLDLLRCNDCIGINWRGDLLSNEADYLYLLARKKLIEGMDISLIEEYQRLCSMKKKKECDSLKRIDDYRFKINIDLG